MHALERRHWRLLALLGSATLFLGYDGSIFALVLPFLARDFQVAPAGLSGPLALLQLASIAAIPFNRLADRQGRRGVLILAALGYALANLGSAFAPTLGTLIATRLAAKLLSSVEVSLAFVMLSEELPAAARGVGLSVLALLGALGVGIVAALLPLAQAPFAWRWLYAGSVPALALVVVLRLHLPETARFLGIRRRAEPLGVLLHQRYRRRSALLGIFFLVTTIPTPAVTFLSTYALGDLQLSPAALTLLIFVAGAAALTGYMAGGYAADTFGRRGVAVIATAGLSAAVLLMYGDGLRGLWIGTVGGAFLVAGSTPAFTAYTNELFPTSARATANAWIGACAVVGSMVGLGFVAIASTPLGGLRASISSLALPPLAALILMRFLPETARRELEDISPDPT